MRQLPAIFTIPEISVYRNINTEVIVKPPNPQGASWHVPEPFLLYGADANTAHVRILKVEDDAMMPESQKRGIALSSIPRAPGRHSVNC